MSVWEIPTGTLYSGNNITARSNPSQNKRSGSYVDFNIKLQTGILQSFQYYLYNPYNTIRSQFVWFQVWEIREQLFHGGTNALLNTSLELIYQQRTRIGTRTGVYTVSFICGHLLNNSKRIVNMSRWY